MELDCSVVTPEAVLKASGHVDKFAGWMCKDPEKGEYLRAEHLIEAALGARLAKHRSAAANGSAQKGVSLDDSTAQEYLGILTKLRASHFLPVPIFYRGIRAGFATDLGARAS